MEIASMVLSGLTFVDQAIKSGHSLAIIARDYRDVGDRLVSSWVRLENQKLSLETWDNIWKAKASFTTDGEEGYRRIWGDRGYTAVLECLGQVRRNLGLSRKILTRIDPQSLAAMVSSRPLPSSSTSKAVPLRKTMKDRLKAFLPFKRNGGSSVVAERNQSQHDLQMAAAAMEASENISAGTKLKWTLAVKEELISFLNETDEWLRQLHEISKLCARERALGNQITNPFDVALRVRKAAKDLFTAIQKPHHPPLSQSIDFKLERERTDPEYFNANPDAIPFLSRGKNSLIFPLSIRNTEDENTRIAIVAEAITEAGGVSASTLQQRPFGEIVQCFLDLELSNALQHPKGEVLHKSGSDCIVVYRVPDGASSPTSNSSIQTVRVSLYEFLEAQQNIDPFLSSYKRLQLANLIAISVLHLYETGWVWYALNPDDILFYGPAEAQCDEYSAVAPFISVKDPNARPHSPSRHPVSPFSSLQAPELPDFLSFTRPDAKLSNLFHELGILLFEIGRGKPIESCIERNKFGNVARGYGPDQRDLRTLLLQEIDKIDLGYSKPYKELVLACLSGQFCISPIKTIDESFHYNVVEKYVVVDLYPPAYQGNKLLIIDIQG
jgi:hypothetical protein